MISYEVIIPLIVSFVLLLVFLKTVRNEDKVAGAEETVNLALKLFRRHKDRVSYEDFIAYIRYEAKRKAEGAVFQKKEAFRIEMIKWQRAKYKIYDELMDKSFKVDEDYFYLSPDEMLIIMNKHYEIEDNLIEQIGSKRYMRIGAY